MRNDIDAILISAGDDVVTLTREAPMGKTVRYLDGGDMAEIVSLGAPKFHKIAVRDIPAGCEIKKYGEVIGRAPDGIYGAVSFINQNGCGESSRNLRRTQDVLVGMAANPNVYGVVAIGLGCEMNRMDGFIKELRARTDKPIEGLLIQEEGGTIGTVAKAKKIARRMVIEASMCRREECDISELMLGIECGGSDATSGLVSNPVMGIISDRIIAAGCQLIVFTTGRGNAIGSAVAPVMKVTANGDTARKLSDNIDLDMSAVLEEGVSLDAMADITMQQILDTLSGRLTSAETLKLGYSEAVISRACEYC